MSKCPNPSAVYVDTVKYVTLDIVPEKLLFNFFLNFFEEWKCKLAIYVGSRRFSLTRGQRARQTEGLPR